MGAAMVLGMLLGMAALLPVLLLAQLFTSPFEIAMPGMPAAMISGMLAGMAAATGPAARLDWAGYGLAIGLGVQLVFHLYDLSLHGEVSEKSVR